MDRKNRPLGREKNVIGGSAHAGRREGGPVSSAGHRPVGGQSASGGRPSVTGGQPISGNRPPVTGGQPISGGQTRSGGRSPLLLILILAAVAIFGGGGGALGGLFGGGGDSGSGGLGEYLDLLNNASFEENYVTDQVVSEPEPSFSGSSVDTTVAGVAREKRTVLKGGGRDKTTILVYMCGTDLESKGGYATKDLSEMAAANLNDKVTLLVFTGGCSRWQNSIISSSKNQIYQIRDGGLAKLWESDSLKPMTDPATLAEFIQWGKKNAPADRYELIFWDHGGGSISGYGYDEVHARSGSMTLDGIAAALKQGGCTFDFVGFDACLMATLETALVVEPYADYLIASEEAEPGCGWYYTGWLNNLAKDPSRAALDIGKDIADSFVSVCSQEAPRQQATLSVMDLAELSGTLPASFQAFAQSTAQSIKNDQYQAVATARANTKEFAKSSNIDQIDLIHLANNINTAESRELAAMLKSAVKYNATSRNIQNANGVSIYFPYGRMSNVNKMAQTYDKIGLDSAYTECIKDFASVETAGQSVYGGSSAQMDSLFGALLGGGGSNGGSSGMIDGGAVADLLGVLLGGRSLPEVGLTQEEGGFLNEDLIENSAGFLAEHQFDKSLLVWSEKNGRRVLWMPEEQWDQIQNAELNVFVKDGDGYIDLGLDNVLEWDDDGSLIGEYDGTWLSVNGQPVAYYMTSSEGTADDYKIMGRIPALLNGQQVELAVCFTDETPQGEILGAAPCYDEETETETVARGLMGIRVGDEIDFLCDYYDNDRNYQDSYYLGDTLVVDGPLTLGNIHLDNGSFIAAYRLTDIYQNHFWTPSIP